MQKTVLNEVFELLQQIGAVNSESEFSKDWLCRSECYMRTLRFKRVKPSVGKLAICASKLKHYGRCMTATEQQHRHPKLGFKRENFELRFSAVEYLQKRGGDFASPHSASC